MSGLIEAKLDSGKVAHPIKGSGDQASILRALIGESTPVARIAGEAVRSRRGEPVLRIAWLVDRQLPRLRAAIAVLAATVGRSESARVAWDTNHEVHGTDIDTAGLLIVCDSCERVGDALRRARRAIADRPWCGARTMAANAWIGTLGLSGDATDDRTLGAALRGMRQAIDHLMDEPVELLGVQRIARRRALWGGRGNERGLSDGAFQEIEQFLCSRARSACALG